MPEASIVITAKDKYSSTIKALANQSKSFSKNTEDLERRLELLDRTQGELSDSMAACRKEMKEAQKEFDATGSSVAKMKFDEKREELTNLTRSMAAVKSATKGVEKDIRALNGSLENTGSAGKRGFGALSGAIGSIATQFAMQMGSQILQPGINAAASSLLGSNGGAVVSNALSMAVSGAAIGAVIPVVGPAVGAAIGAGIGAASSGLQIFEEQDNAFKSYVQDQTEGILSQRQSDIQSGSSIAAQRESDLRGLSSLFGGDERAAKEYQQQLIEVGRTPPFSYATALGLSREMLGLGLSKEQSMQRIDALSNAAAALNLSEGNVSTIVSTLESAQLSGKLESRVVKSLSKMGLNVYEALGEEFGISTDKVAENLSKLDVERAIGAIYDYMGNRYSGAAAGLTDSYNGAAGKLASYQEDMNAEYGIGYNEERNKGIQAQIDWLDGASGEAQKEANKAIGAWQASLENAKEGYIRDAVDAAMASDEYQKAKAEGDAATMGRLIAAAKVKGNSDYLANEGKDEELADQIALAEAIRTDETTMAAYQTAGYTMGQEFSKGMADAVLKNMTGQDNVFAAAVSGYLAGGGGISYSSPNGSSYAAGSGLPVNGSHASGLARVPYDNYLALLHEGERVLTAREARQVDQGGGIVVTVSGNQFTVREDADIDKIAKALAEQISLQRQAGVF